MIPYGKQDVTENDIEAVVKVLRSDFLTQGAIVPKFEQKLCEYTGAKYSIAVNSCTSALHIACLALDLGPGDILWTSPITFVASANCALYCGATVDFVDIEQDTALMSVEKLSAKLEEAEKKGKLPKIIIAVHFAGQPSDMKEIHVLSKQYGFSIIEDAAHAIGAKYKNKPVGNCQYSDITVFSFHPVKIITTGEGGAILTNSINIEKKSRMLINHGITRNRSQMEKNIKDLWYYEQKYLGYNYRLTDIQAALGISQIDRLDSYVADRQRLSKYYDSLFSSTDIKPLIRKSDRYSSCHLYIIKIPESKSRSKIFMKLRNMNIGVNVHYIPVYNQPYYKKNIYLKNTELYYDKAITLPLYPSLKHSQLDQIFSRVMLSIK